MSDTLSKPHLRELRNRIEMIPLIAEVLELIYKTHDGRFRFMCPLCHDFDTAVNLDTNLARCFRCQRNFNPIDMVMTVKRYSFMQAVRYLQPILEHLLARAGNRPSLQNAPTRSRP
ncbi:MAG: CHC2 zinc finger domain-containing protein [Kiritimatiellaeota bacterium]|nr:CHC2 zinc finger domain-containing protein [Kiritimatiellota bacterium]